MQLQRLTGLERQKILDELAELLKLIERLRAILVERRAADADRRRRADGDPRRSTATSAAPRSSTTSGEFRIEDLIADEDMAITVTHTGYIKRTPISTYRSQRRGGKGRIGMRTREEDFVSHLFVASTHAYILIFTDRGRCYWLKVHEIPDVGRRRQGQGDRQPRVDGGGREDRGAARGAGVPDDGSAFIVMGTRKGVDQEDRADRVQQPARRRHHRDRRRRGDAVIAVADDRRQRARSSSARATAWRSASPRADVRPMGRTAYGVRGITLRDDDEVVGDGGRARRAARC